MKSIVHVLFFVLALMALRPQSIQAQAQGGAVPFVDTTIHCWNFHSVTMGDDYTLYVHLPPGYDTAHRAYPVLYLTDGDWDVEAAINSFNMLRQDYFLTEAVIVGIGYGNRPNQRTRDLEPTRGAPHFLTFIEKELIPFIARQYRVTDDRTLSGYSYGGLFAAYALFNRPGLFSAVCIGAPARSETLVTDASAYFATNKVLPTKIFLSAGSYEHGPLHHLQQFRDFLLQQPGRTGAVLFDSVPIGGHGAAKPQVIQDGVSFVFCKKHTPIVVTAAQLQRYAGNYALVGQPDKRIQFFVDHGKLYGGSGKDSTALIPFTPGGFFMYENEKAEMFFKVENGQLYELYVPANGKSLRFDRVD